MESHYRAEKPALKKKTNKNNLPLIMVLLIVFLICIFLSSGMLVYKLGPKNAYLKKMAEWIPFPAAVVNYDFVTLENYYQEVEDVRNVFLMQGELTAEVEEKMKQDILDKMIHDAIIMQLVKEFNVKLTDEDIEAEKQKVIEEVSTSREELEARLQELYGWDFDTFFDKVVLSSVYQEKVREQFIQDENIQEDAEKEARKVLKLVQKGEQSFQDIAKEHSDDPTFAQLGGDLGWIQKGLLPQDFEDTAFSLEKGDVSDLIKTEWGYHIVRIEDKKEDGSEIWIYDIFISYQDFEQYILDYTADSKVYKLVK